MCMKKNLFRDDLKDVEAELQNDNAEGNGAEENLQNLLDCLNQVEE